MDNVWWFINADGEKFVSNIKLNLASMLELLKTWVTNY